ncbi:interactor of HORMAD1 protein 1 [Pseudonaja textilis]|uniref:interactor of HORMAD1 protein 1 n=1 Tax=Pseudonaja textilis TaxID=8673 RepID=UPI000EAA420D|nr:interactor of HORMAD1 protein 1 [Pseudonaja textilis]
MNLNLWNTKDIFMTPTKMGPYKSSGWTSAPNEHNSMSDSQFLFGSQFCSENSQSASASAEFTIPQRQDKGSQQNSQDNDISIFAKYQSKPQLFGKEEKENVSFNNFSGRFKGVMEQFEENKKKIKEKYDNDLLNAFILNTKESLQKLQSSFSMLEETLKSVLNDLGNISKTMQETSQSHYGLLLNALGEKNETGQILLGMEKRLQEKDTEISDLKSSLQLLKDSLEQFTVQQNQQHLKICEQLDHMKLSRILNDLQAFISAPRESHHLKDNSSQTSPDALLDQLSYSCHLNVLNISPANKDISTKAGSESKGNFDTRQKSRIPLGGPSADKTLCCCSASLLAKSQERKWSFSQEPHEATPVRKVIQRNNQAKGYSATKHSQLNHPEMDNGFVRNRAGDGKSEELIPGKMNNKSKGNRVKQGKPWLSSQRKRMYPSRKGNGLKYSRANVKQDTTGKGASIVEYACKETRESGSISLRPLVLSEKKTGSLQDRKAKKSKLLFLSHENQQPTPNLHERPGIKGNHCFWPCSSPESSFPQTQIKWLDLFDNYSLTNCHTPVPKNATACCQLFFDSEYSD